MGGKRFLQYYLDALVAGLGRGIFFASANDFAVSGHVVEAVLASGKE